MVHRRGDGTLALKPVVELNVRMTMGRIAWEWMKRGPSRQGGCLKILRKQTMEDAQIAALAGGPGWFLNDPAAATTFLAYWSA